MIELGFRNVKVVKEMPGGTGGDEMEKYFSHYKDGKIINPITGTVTTVITR
jgi:hypothetical protein